MDINILRAASIARVNIQQVRRDLEEERERIREKARVAEMVANQILDAATAELALFPSFARSRGAEVIEIDDCNGRLMIVEGDVAWVMERSGGRMSYTYLMDLNDLGKVAIGRAIEGGGIKSVRVQWPVGAQGERVEVSTVPWEDVRVGQPDWMIPEILGHS